MAEMPQNMSSLSLDIEEKYLEENKYKHFETSVGKCLKASEQAREWADLISFLGRLNKVLQVAPEHYTFVPHKHMVSRRLAQCLNASLPAGVHLKAIEVYQIIFKRLGPIQIRKDLYLYTMGLFPLFYYASINVKVALFDLYEKYFLPMGNGLVPCLKGLVLAVLPGLEEGSEFVPRCLAFLNSLAKEVDPVHFYGTLWSALLTTPNLRQYTVMYLSTKLKAETVGDTSVKKVPHVLGNDKHLLAAAIAAGLTDRNTLVLRGVLEILVSLFPIHIDVFSEREVKVVLLPALAVVLRRDMSLNRRLYTWLLGPSSGSGRNEADSEREYFLKHSKESVVAAMRTAFLTKPLDKTSALAPYKVLVVLAEKEQIGRHVVRDLLVPVLRSLWIALEESPPWVQDVYRASQLFFSMLDPSIVFTHLANQIDVSDLRCISDVSSSKPNLTSENEDDSNKLGTVGFVDGMGLLEFAMEVLEFKPGSASSAVTIPHLMLLMIEKITPRIEVLDYSPHLLHVNHVFKRMVECIAVDKPTSEIQVYLFSVSKCHGFAEYMIRFRLASDLVNAEDHANSVDLFVSLCDLVVEVAETLSRYGAYGKHIACVSSDTEISRSSAESDTNVEGRHSRSSSSLNKHLGNGISRSSYNSDTHMSSPSAARYKVSKGATTHSPEVPSIRVSQAPTASPQIGGHLNVGFSDASASSEQTVADSPVQVQHVSSNTSTDETDICTQDRNKDGAASDGYVQHREDSTRIAISVQDASSASTITDQIGSLSIHSPVSAPKLDRASYERSTSVPIMQSQKMSASPVTAPCNSETKRSTSTRIVSKTDEPSRKQRQYNSLDVNTSTKKRLDVENGESFGDGVRCVWGAEVELFDIVDVENWNSLAVDRSQDARNSLVSVVEALMTCIEVKPWRAVVTATRAVLSVMSVAGSAIDLKPFQIQTSRKLWDWLDPSNGLRYEQTVELVNAFLALHTHVDSDVCERIICSDLSNTVSTVRCRAAMRLASMWRVSDGLAEQTTGRVSLRRATLCMLDLLDDEDLSTQLEARSWLSCSLGTLASILDPLFEILLHPTTHRRPAGQLTGAQKQVTLVYRRTPDNAQIEYALTTLMSMLKVDPSALLFALCTTEFRQHHFAYRLYTAQKESLGVELSTPEPRSYFDLLVISVLWFIQTDHVDVKYTNRPKEDGFVHNRKNNYLYRQPQNSRLQVLSAQFLHRLLNQARLPAHTSNQYRTLSAYIGPSASFTRLASVDESGDQGAGDILHIYTHASHTMMQRPEVYENMVVTHLDEIENVVLGRLAAVVTPKHLELQVALLQLLQSVVVLDNIRRNTNPNDINTQDIVSRSDGTKPVNASGGDKKVRFASIAENPLFLDTILIALNMPSLRSVHAYWITYVLACMPHMGSHLNNIVPSVVQCLSGSLAVNTINSNPLYDGDNKLNYVPWHSVTMLEGIGAILHYCLAWSPIKITNAHTKDIIDLNAGVPVGAGTTGQMLSNFMQMFGAEAGEARLSTTEELTDLNVLKAFDDIVEPLAAVWTSLNQNTSMAFDARRSSGSGDGLQDAIRTVPKPPVLKTRENVRRGSMSQVLSSSGAAKKQRQKDITRERILEILEMVFVRHPHRLIESFMLAWNAQAELGPLFTNNPSDAANDDTTKAALGFESGNLGDARREKRCSVQITSQQQALVDMLLELCGNGRFRVFIQSIQDIHKRLHPQLSSGPNAPTTIAQIVQKNEALLLQMLLCNIEQCKPTFVSHSLGSIITLLAEVISSFNYLPSISVVLVTIHTITSKVKLSMDHRHRRRFQELVGRVVTTLINNVVTQISSEGAVNVEDTDKGDRLTRSPGKSNKKRQHHSSWRVKDEPSTSRYDPVGEALLVLSTSLMPLLNLLYTKTEKDRVVVLLLPLLPSLLPLLRPSGRAIPEYKMCCLQLFVSVSSQIYTLRAWRSIVFEMFMEPKFFKMKVSLIPQWRTLIEHLCTFDKMVLADIIEQTKSGNSGALNTATLNIFTSQTQELENKSRLVKRIAFVLYSGAMDEYYADLPAIMECIVECLRPPSSPVVQERVFLLFRIMLLRMSEQHLLPWWPTALTEVVRVLDRALQACRAQACRAPPHPPRSQTGTVLSDQKELNVLLGVCKFVDLVILLSVQIFHMHQWTFVEEVVNSPVGCKCESESKDNDQCDDDTQAVVRKKSGPNIGMFVAYMTRLSDALGVKSVHADVYVDEYVQKFRGPLLTMRTVSSVYDLAPFMSTVSKFNFLASVSRSLPDHNSIQRIIDLEFTEWDT
eukprot:CFRG3076T1